MKTKNLKIMALSIIGILFAFHRPTRDWIIRQGTSYLIIVAFILLLEIPLLLMGILLPWRIFPAIAFLLTIILFLLTWIPVGVVNAALNPAAASNGNSHFYPQAIRRLIGWLAFAGWLGIIHNEWLNFWVVIAGAFLFFIFSAFSKTNVDKLVTTFVTILTLWTIWSYISPDSYRAFSRFCGSASGVVIATSDRQAIKNETSASVTYAYPNRDINVVYLSVLDQDGNIANLLEREKKLTPKSLVKVFNHKNSVQIYQGQGFLEIQLADANGSFVNGQKYWIEADFLNIVTPEDIKRAIQKEENDKKMAELQKAKFIADSIYQANIKTKTPVGNPALNNAVNRVVTLNPGTYHINNQAGHTTETFIIPNNGNFHYDISSPTFNHRIIFSDGTSCDDGPDVILPTKSNIAFRIKSNVDEIITIVVIKRV